MRSCRGSRRARSLALCKKLLHRPKTVTGRIADARALPGVHSDRGRRARARRRRARPSSRTGSGRRSSSTARRRCAQRARALSRRRHPTARRSTGRRRSRTSRCSGCSREEGIGADVASSGELAFARAEGSTGDELVIHGNKKSDEAFRAAAAAGAIVVLDAPDEAARAAAAGVKRVLVRVTLGVDADTHEAIRTGHHGSKFGLPPEQALSARRCARRRPRRRGLHVHVGSQLADFAAQAETIQRLAAFAAVPQRARLDAGGRRPRRRLRHPPRPDEPEAADLGSGRGGSRTRSSEPSRRTDLPARGVGLEPGRSLVGAQASRSTASARSSGSTELTLGRGRRRHVRQPEAAALRREVHRAAREPRRRGGDETVSVAGMHCESGDVLIDDVELPSPRRDDLLAVPATGAYTLAMSSNYNGVPRPAAVLVRDGDARLIRRRETVDDLLARPHSSTGSAHDLNTSAVGDHVRRGPTRWPFPRPSADDPQTATRPRSAPPARGWIESGDVLTVAPGRNGGGRLVDRAGVRRKRAAGRSAARSPRGSARGASSSSTETATTGSSGNAAASRSTSPSSASSALVAASSAGSSMPAAATSPCTSPASRRRRGRPWQ